MANLLKPLPLTFFIAEHDVIRHGISLVSSGHMPGYVPSQPLVHHPIDSLEEQSEKQRRPWYYVSNAQKQLTHWCVTSIVYITNLKHSTMWAVIKTINSSPARTCISIKQTDISFSCKQVLASPWFKGSSTLEDEQKPLGEKKNKQNTVKKYTTTPYC